MRAQMVLNIGFFNRLYGHVILKLVKPVVSLSCFEVYVVSDIPGLSAQ